MENRQKAIEHIGELRYELRRTLAKDARTQHLFPPGLYPPEDEFRRISGYISGSAIEEDIKLGLKAYLGFLMAGRMLYDDSEHFDAGRFSILLAGSSQAKIMFAAHQREKGFIPLVQLGAATFQERSSGGRNSNGYTEDERIQRNKMILAEFDRLAATSDKFKGATQNEKALAIQRKLDPGFKKMFIDGKPIGLRTYLRTLKDHGRF